MMKQQKTKCLLEGETPDSVYCSRGDFDNFDLSKLRPFYVGSSTVAVCPEGNIVSWQIFFGGGTLIWFCLVILKTGCCELLEIFCGS